MPAPPEPIGAHHRIRILAADVSLATEPPGPSSILNVLKARIVSGQPVDSQEVLVVIALGADGGGARLLSRITRKSWDVLALHEGLCVFARVKAVKLR